MIVDWFGGRLRELREAKGWTRKQLAELASLSESGVRDLELSNRKPAWETVLALSAALGVDCTAFPQPPADREPAGPGGPKPHPPPVSVSEPPGKAAGRPAK